MARHMTWGRIHRHRPAEGEPPDQDGVFVEVQPEELAGIFAVPNWLRELGVMAWLLVGITVLLVGAVWLLALLNTIVAPVVTASIVAAVLSPVVRRLATRLPRAAAAALVFVVLLVVAIGIAVLVIAGITSQAASLQDNLQGAVDKLQTGLQDAGASADKAQSAGNDASATVSSAFDALIHGLGRGIGALASLVVFLSFTMLSLFFLLKDGPVIRGWTERHMGVPASVAHIVTGRTIHALRGYFAGVTVVAAFNAVVIGLGALVLGVPEVGAIALVNFFAAYVPYLGAWSAGAFTVLVALGSGGTDTAVVMGVVVLLANGALQQLVQPIAFGTALGIHPLAVLIVTIAGGALFGTIGLVLGAPLTSAVVHISTDLARARAREDDGRAEAASGREATAADVPAPG